MPTEYRTITEIAGPLIFVEKTEWVGYGELVEVGLPDGSRKRGQVLDSSKDIVVVQVFEGTAGIDRQSTVKFLGETIKLNVSREMLGRILSGAGEPMDGGAAPRRPFLEPRGRSRGRTVNHAPDGPDRGRVPRVRSRNAHPRNPDRHDELCRGAAANWSSAGRSPRSSRLSGLYVHRSGHDV